MPELPEVETVRRRLEPHVAGRRLTHVEVRDTKLVGRDDARRVEERLAGRTILTIDRRGKYLLFLLDGEETLVSHLRMTGNWLLFADGEPKYTRAVLAFSDATLLAYADARRFGTWDLLTNDEAAAYLAARLGPEPIDSEFDGAVLKAAFAGRRAPVKALLLDQRLVAGVGNIYADEALWRAGVNGARIAEKLSRRQLGGLLDSAAEVMREALGQGGTSFDSLYVNVNGQSGYFDRSLNVYGREGRNCHRCGAVIRREKFMNRSSFYCPRCQPRPRAR